MKTRTHITGGAAAGFSLVELMLVAAVLGLIVGSVAMLGRAGEQAYRTSATAAHLEAQAATTVERIVAELRIAGLATIAPDPIPGVGSDAIQYLQATGMTNGQVQWTTLRRLAFEYEAGEIDDGLDNNKNGLVDEGRVVLREDFGGPAERPRVLTRWVREVAEGEVENGVDDDGDGLVDERGFFVERFGETLVVRLTLQRRDAEGRLLTRTARTSVRSRN